MRRSWASMIELSILLISVLLINRLISTQVNKLSNPEYLLIHFAVPHLPRLHLGLMDQDCVSHEAAGRG